MTKINIQLKVGKLVFCTHRARLDVYRVTRVIYQGRPPRYVLRAKGDENLGMELVIGKEDEWFNKYVFTDIQLADRDVEKQIEEEVNKWANGLLRNKEQLMQFFFGIWDDMDRIAVYGDDLLRGNVEIANKKREVMTAKIKEYYGITIKNRPV